MVPTLNAKDLVEQKEPINVPQPDLLESPTDFVQRAVQPTIVQADTTESRQRDDVFNQIQQVGENRASFDGEFNNQLQQLGTPDAVNRIRDVQTELNRLNTQFSVQNTQIADGNSIGQAQREVSQNERERAVRTAGLAAQAQLLQGNIQTAQSIARDAVNFAFQDEQAELNQLGRQYDALQDRVKGQEAQILDQRRNELAERQAELDNLRGNVQNAIQSGATPEEVAKLTDPKLSNEDKLALASQVQARAASEDRELDLAGKRSDLFTDQLHRENLRSQIADRAFKNQLSERSTAGNPNGTLDGKPQTANQATAHSYGNRLVESERVLAVVNDEFASNFAIGGFLPNQLKGDTRLQFEQAKRNFVNAVLRRESGAVISEEEFANADKQYFAQPGDSPEVLQQKAANRNTVINNFYREANTFRPVAPGDIITSDGVRYQVGEDGETITPLE